MSVQDTYIVVKGGRLNLSEIEKIVVYSNADNLNDNVSHSFFKLKNSSALICIDNNDVQYFEEKYSLKLSIIDGQIP